MVHTGYCHKKNNWPIIISLSFDKSGRYFLFMRKPNGACKKVHGSNSYDNQDQAQAAADLICSNNKNYERVAWKEDK